LQEKGRGDRLKFNPRESSGLEDDGAGVGEDK